MVKWSLIIFIVVAIVAMTFLFNNGGFTTGFSIENRYDNYTFLGTFYDSAKGTYFSNNYDIFYNNRSMGIFDSALEACQTIFPGSRQVWETKVATDQHEFTDRNGNKKVMTSYTDYCYG